MIVDASPLGTAGKILPGSSQSLRELRVLRVEMDRSPPIEREKPHRRFHAKSNRMTNSRRHFARWNRNARAVSDQVELRSPVMAGLDDKRMIRADRKPL